MFISFNRNTFLFAHSSKTQQYSQFSLTNLYCVKVQNDFLINVYKLFSVCVIYDEEFEKNKKRFCEGRTQNMSIIQSTKIKVNQSERRNLRTKNQLKVIERCAIILMNTVTDCWF